MARPSRCRRVCLEPEFKSFVTCGMPDAPQITLTVDEYETLRLIDYEGKTQEECAAQMGISRTTTAEIYAHARNRLADFLVNGGSLTISGGNYRLCDGSAWACCGKLCARSASINAKPAFIRKEADTMKIAVTYDNGEVFQHFGHTEQFKIYSIENGEITGAEIVGTNGSGHGALAGFLAARDVDTLICGGIGGGAVNALTQAGIHLYAGMSGNTDEAVKALLAGQISPNSDATCDHHGHGNCHDDHHEGCHEAHHCGE